MSSKKTCIATKAGTLAGVGCFGPSTTKRTPLVTTLATALAMILATALSAAATEPASTYSGDLAVRSTLTGDWGGYRNDWAAKGLTVDASATEVEQGIVSGGKSHHWDQGGRANITTNIDTGKMGLWPGGFFTLELEGNYDHAVNALKTGAISPVNSNQLYPEPAGDNFNMPQLTFAQFLSPYFGIMLGKFDTSSADMNAFAHGKGDEQFLNLAFQINPVAVVACPYSTLGVAAIFLPTKDPEAALVNVSVLQANGNASDSGFSALSGSKLLFAAEGRIRTNFFDLTGHQDLGAEYSNKTFTALDQRLGFILENRTTVKEDDSWAIWYNFDQYLYEPDKGSSKGFGLFGRLGGSDGDANPMAFMASLGLGGEGMIPGRDNDRFGAGYYYLNINGPTLTAGPFSRSFLHDEHGFEAYYNFAVTPWMWLTADAQVIDPSQEKRPLTGQKVDTDIIIGFRQQILF